MQLLYSLFVLVPILLLSGVTPTWRWLELAPAIAVQSLFCLGLAFVVARIGARIPDTTQILPFLPRVDVRVGRDVQRADLHQGPPRLGGRPS